MNLQRTVNSVLTVCLSLGDNPRTQQKTEGVILLTARQLREREGSELVKDSTLARADAGADR